MGDDTDDLDRAAILARRQRFITLALSGLAVSCGSGGGPVPCLEVSPPATDTGSTGGGATDGETETGSTGASGTGSDGPTAGSSGGDGVSSSGGDAADTSTTGGDSASSTGDGNEQGTTGRPVPCLGVQPDP